MARKIKNLGLTNEEIKELAQKQEEVWVVYRHGKMHKFPANIFVNSDRGERVFFTNYWFAFAVSQQRLARYKSKIVDR